MNYIAILSCDYQPIQSSINLDIPSSYSILIPSNMCLFEGNCSKACGWLYLPLYLLRRSVYSMECKQARRVAHNPSVCGHVAILKEVSEEKDEGSI